MKNIIAQNNELKVKQDVVNDIFNDELVKAVKEQITLFDPVCELINKCQSRCYSVADSAEDWLSLKLPEQFEGVLSDRRSMALNIYCTTANYLHPVYRGKKLSDFQKDRVQDFLVDELNSDGLDSLQQFQLAEGIFGVLAAKQIVNVRTYWRIAERSNENLSKLAQRLIRTIGAVVQQLGAYPLRKT